MELGKVPPHDIEAEQAVIGSMLTDKDSVISAIEVLKPEDEVKLTAASSEEAAYYAALADEAKGLAVTVEAGE